VLNEKKMENFAKHNPKSKKSTKGKTPRYERGVDIDTIQLSDWSDSEVAPSSSKKPFRAGVNIDTIELSDSAVAPFSSKKPFQTGVDIDTIELNDDWSDIETESAQPFGKKSGKKSTKKATKKGSSKKSKKQSRKSFATDDLSDYDVPARFSSKNADAPAAFESYAASGGPSSAEPSTRGVLFSKPRRINHGSTPTVNRKTRVFNRLSKAELQAVNADFDGLTKLQIMKKFAFQPDKMVYTYANVTVPIVGPLSFM